MAKKFLDSAGLTYFINKIVYGITSPKFSTGSTYTVGDFVIYTGALYRCTTAVTVAGAWSASKWVQTTVKAELATINSNMKLIRTYVSSDGLLHFVNSAGADSVLPFSPNKNGPCVYIHTRASTEQNPVSFTTASAGTVYYRYVGESAGGAYTIISKNGTAVKTGTQGTTAYDEGSGSFAVVKGDTVSGNGFIGSASGGSYTYFLILRCVYS